MSAEELLRRYLRQRVELGESELILEQVELGALAARPTWAEGAPERIAAPAAAGPAAAPPAPVVLTTGHGWEDLRSLALGCVRCRLCETRTQVVFGEGSTDAELVVVGEAPGADEDRTGRPFIGRAGKLLDRLLASVGFERDQVYICNVIKCRPPGNRNPQPDEVATCSPYLRRQIELVGPRAILAVGAFAAQTLLETDAPIGRLRGGRHTAHGVPLVATYHPAALLRNPSWIRPVWEDLQRLRGELAPARA